MTALTDLAARLEAARAITGEDVLALRRQVWPDGIVGAEEAELAFRLNQSVAQPTREWTDFFVEAITEYVVNGVEPKGYVDARTGDWLIAQVERDGMIETLGELELLVKILEVALDAPASLRAFALAEIERAVLIGEGATRTGTLDPGGINADEVALLRRILFARAGDGPGIVSASEAELLFRLKDATIGAANAPGWRDLFVRGVANYLMAHIGYRPLDRAEAERLNAFMRDSRPRIGGFLGRMAGSLLSGEALAALRPPRVATRRAGDVAASATITPSEQAWLDRHIAADATIDAFEQALLDFIAAERAGR